MVNALVDRLASKLPEVREMLLIYTTIQMTGVCKNKTK